MQPQKHGGRRLRESSCKDLCSRKGICMCVWCVCGVCVCVCDCVCGAVTSWHHKRVLWYVLGSVGVWDM